MSKLALELIAQEKKEKTGYLELGHCGLTPENPLLPQVWDALGELTHLETLILSSIWEEWEEWEEKKSQGYFIKASRQKKADNENHLNKIPRAIGQLTSLKKLILAGHYSDSWKISKIAWLDNLQQLEYLDLGYNKIERIALPNSLSKLEIVRLGNNLIEKTAGIEGLKSLKILSLGNNKIKNIQGLNQLSQLRVLHLWHNQLSDIAGLGKLPQLQHLHLNSNQISDITGLNKLPQLQHLVLYSNQISDITGLDKLTSLKILNLAENKIQDLRPIHHLIHKGIPVRWAIHKGGIPVANNPLIHPPVETVKEGNAAILRYFEELDRSGETQVKEAKLLLTGSGEVGKTSLRLRLNDRNCPLPQKDERTRQVDVDSYRFPLSDEEGEFTAHVWDFGGQQIVHHFHRFFMNDSALYLLLTETSRENDDFDYWLQTIQLYGKDSPILFVQNKRNGMPRSLDIKPYRQHFNIKEQLFEVNMLTNEGVDELEKAIRYHIQKLPHTQRVIPRSWLRIRTELEERRKAGAAFISYLDFVKLCQEAGDITTRLGVMDVGRFFHKLGVILWYDENNLLKQKVILERHWATEGIFRLVFHAKVQAAGGFSLAQAQAIWDEEQQYGHHAEDLIAMMREFKICFPQKNRPNHYIIPALLTATEPEVSWQMPRRLVIEYQYNSILPRGLVNFLTAEMYADLAADEHAWGTGVWLHQGEAQAKISENRFKRKVRIELGGKEYRELFGAIKLVIDDIHRQYRGVEAELMIPCICETCQAAEVDEVEHFKYADVLRRIDHPKKQTITCNQSLDDIRAVDLLHHILLDKHLDWPGEKAGRRKAPKRIFLSYAHADLAYRDELEKRIKPLLRGEQSGELWYDHKIIAGQNWDEEIRRELQQADIIILLISDDFWASDYIHNEELPLIRKRFEQKECKVIPILVRANSHWDTSEWQAFQGIPTRAASGKLTPISSWTNQDEAWKEVVDQVRGLLL